MRNTSSRAQKKSKKMLWFFAALLVLVVIGIVLKLTVFNSPEKGAESGNTGGQATKGEPIDQTKSSSSANASSTDGSQPGDQKDNNGGTSTAKLLAPDGQFISNHVPGQNNTPPNSETSVCNTTPGATCQIVFINGATTKSLPPQTTDRGGSTYWNNWDPQNILTPGSWQIEAVSSLNGQTMTTKDAIPLVISQ